MIANPVEATAVPAAVDLSFVEVLDSQVELLLGISTDEKLDAFDNAARFFFSARGKTARDQLIAELVDAGYPEQSARDETEMLPSVLSRRFLETIVENKAALPGGKLLLDGQFVPVADGVMVGGFPVGPVLVVGSGNSFLPALAAALQALLASCPVALRGSRLNQRVLELVVQAMRRGGGPALGSVLDCLHLFFVDHRVPADAEQLAALLRDGPFAAATFWGGGAALDVLVAELAKNPRHPVAIPMEPLTGMALVTARYLTRSHGAADDAATDLAKAMTMLGQQLCSSPTEAVLIGSRSVGDDFAGRLGRELDRSGRTKGRVFSTSYGMLLDRVRDRCEEEGSTVLVPRSGDASWTVLVSSEMSVFEALPADLVLPVHDRHAFLEVVCVDNLAAAADRINGLPRGACHAGVKQVQTVLRLAHVPDAQHVVQLLRGRGGVYRVVPPDFVAARHPLEPFDGQHLVSLFTRQVVVI